MTRPAFSVSQHSSASTAFDTWAKIKQTKHNIKYTKKYIHFHVFIITTTINIINRKTKHFATNYSETWAKTKNKNKQQNTHSLIFSQHHNNNRIIINAKTMQQIILFSVIRKYKEKKNTHTHTMKTHTPVHRVFVWSSPANQASSAAPPDSPNPTTK
jgi:hypothetical protein